MQNRRSFLKTIGLGTAALALPNSGLFAFNENPPKLGIQLYTLRYEIGKDFDKTVGKVAEIGYKGIESYALPENITLEHASRTFKDNGLEVFSIHSELPVRNEFENAVRTAEIYNSPKVVYHGWPEEDKYKDEDNMKAAVEFYNGVNEKFKKEGLQFGLHNHWWEFEDHNGVKPFYYLLENLSDDIFFEIDTYWVKTGGMNPVEVLKDFGNRAKLLHIKDGPAVKGDLMYSQMPAGSGSLNFPAIYKASKDNVEWMIVEFDEFGGNIFRGIKSSYNYLTENEFAKGNK